MVQDLIVGLVVIAAALYAFWIFLPAGVRRAGAARLASLARHCGLGEPQSQRLQATLATQSSCGGCDSCKGCATAGAKKYPAGGPHSDRPRSE